MTSHREREIIKVLNFRTLIQIFAFAGFYLPFLYNWVFLLAPTQTALIYSVLIGLGTIGLLYVPWKKTTARLKRLQKYDVLFGEFFEAMITDMRANYEEKGDTWLTREIEKLTKQLDQKWEDLLSDPKQDRQSELVKLSNYCAMLYIRGLIA